jgi:hypothetical protein
MPEEGDPGVTVWRNPDGTVSALGQTLDRTHWIYLPGLAAFRFEPGATDVSVTPQPDAAPELVVDNFQRVVLPLALQALGREVLHASAVRTAQGVVAFCGVAGSGKSTLAYGLSRRGYSVWADDAVCFDVSETPIAAHPLPFAIRLRHDSAAYFTAGETPAEVVADGSRAPLAALFVLNRAEGLASAELQRLPSVEAFSAALTHAHCFTDKDVQRNRRMVNAYLELSGRVPIFELLFEAGLGKLPLMLELIEEAVEGVGASAK